MIGVPNNPIQRKESVNNFYLEEFIMSEKATGPLNRKSLIITGGDKRSPNRAMLRAVCFTDDDFDKPIIGIANGQCRPACQDRHCRV